MNNSKTRAKTASILHSYGPGNSQSPSQSQGQVHVGDSTPNPNRILNFNFNPNPSLNHETNQAQNSNQSPNRNSPKPPTFLPLCPPRNETSVKFITFPSTVQVTPEGQQQSQWLSSPVPVPKMSHSARRFAKSSPILINLLGPSLLLNPNLIPAQKMTSLINSPVLPRRNIRPSLRYRKTPNTNGSGSGTGNDGNLDTDTSTIPTTSAIPNGSNPSSGTSTGTGNGNNSSPLKSSLKKSQDNKSNLNAKSNKNDGAKIEKALKIKDIRKPGVAIQPRDSNPHPTGAGSVDPGGELTACLVPVRGGNGGGGSGAGGGGGGASVSVPQSKGSGGGGGFLGERMQVIRTEQEKLRNPDSIRLDKCGLKHFPVITPSSEPQLKLLSLQHNQITRLENVPALTHLVVLDIYDNRIEKITGLQGLNSLRVLLLGKNRIRRIEGLEGLRRLEILDLHGNQLRYVDNLGCLASLRVLNLAGNNFKTIRLGPANLLALTELNLKRNRIRNLEGLQKAPHLKKILLANNELSSAACLWPLRKLVFLQEILFEPNQLCSSPDYTSQILTIFPWLSILDRSTITDQQRNEAKTWHRKRLAEDEEKKKIEQMKYRATATPVTREEIIIQARRRWQSVKNFVKQASHSTENSTTASVVTTVANGEDKNGQKLSMHELTSMSTMSRILFQTFPPGGPAEIVHKEPLIDFDIPVNNLLGADESITHNFDNTNPSSTRSVALGQSPMSMPMSSLMPLNATSSVTENEKPEFKYTTDSTDNYSTNNTDTAGTSSGRSHNLSVEQKSSQTEHSPEVEPTLSAKLDLETRLESQTALSDDNNDDLTNYSKEPSNSLTTRSPSKSAKIAVVRPQMRNVNLTMDEDEPGTLLQPENECEKDENNCIVANQAATGKKNLNNQISEIYANSQISHLKHLLETQNDEDDTATEECDQLFPVTNEGESISCLIENQLLETASITDQNDVKFSKINANLHLKHFREDFGQDEINGEPICFNSNLGAKEIDNHIIETHLLPDTDGDNSTGRNFDSQHPVVLIDDTEAGNPLKSDSEISGKTSTLPAADGFVSKFKRSASSISLPAITAITDNLNLGDVGTSADGARAGTAVDFNEYFTENKLGKDTLQIPALSPNKNKLALMKNLRSQSFDVGYPGTGGYNLVSSDSESSDGTSSFMTANNSEIGRNGANRKFFPRNRTKVKRDRLLSSKNNNQGGFPAGRRPYTGNRDSSQNRGPNPNKPLKRSDSAVSDLSPRLTSATMKKQGTDYLVEIDGRVLNIYGQGALKYTMMGFPVSLTSHVTTAKFHYISYDTLIPYFGKIRQIYPSLEHFQFRANNLTSLSQLNSLADLQGLTSLHIVKEGNPLITNELWHNYAAYRLSHWGLQNINGKQISSQAIGRLDLSVVSSVSIKAFESLGYVALSCLPQTALTPLAKRLHTLHCFCCCSPSSSSDDSGRRGKTGGGMTDIPIQPNAAGATSPGTTTGQHPCTSWDDDPVLLDVIGKEALVYEPPPLLPDTTQAKQKERTEIPGKIIHTGVEILEKLDLLEKIWPSLLNEVVQDILMDYLLMDNYMKKELKKLQDIALLSKNKLP